jgi:hypothetical protein
VFPDVARFRRLGHPPVFRSIAHPVLAAVKRRARAAATSFMWRPMQAPSWPATGAFIGRHITDKATKDKLCGRPHNLSNAKRRTYATAVYQHVALDGDLEKKYQDTMREVELRQVSESDDSDSRLTPHVKQTVSLITPPSDLRRLKAMLSRRRNIGVP